MLTHKAHIASHSTHVCAAREKHFASARAFPLPSSFPPPLPLANNTTSRKLMERGYPSRFVNRRLAVPTGFHRDRLSPARNIRDVSRGLIRANVSPDPRTNVAYPRPDCHHERPGVISPGKHAALPSSVQTPPRSTDTLRAKRLVYSLPAPRAPPHARQSANRARRLVPPFVAKRPYWPGVPDAGKGARIGLLLPGDFSRSPSRISVLLVRERGTLGCTTSGATDVSHSSIEAAMLASFFFRRREKFREYFFGRISCSSHFRPRKIITRSKLAK